LIIRKIGALGGPKLWKGLSPMIKKVGEDVMGRRGHPEGGRKESQRPSQGASK